MKKVRALSEYSWILCESAPIAYGLHSNNTDYEIESIQGTTEVFYFSDKVNYVSGGVRWGLQTNMIYENKFNPRNLWGDVWTPPPFQEHFSKESQLKKDKPVLVINNKYNPEWGEKIPFNYLDVDCIKNIVDTFGEKYKIYYIRYEGDGNESNESYFDIVGSYGKFEDYELLSKYENVTTIYDVMKEYNIGFNKAQMWIHSLANETIATAGGNAVLSAYFGNDVIIFNCKNCKSENRGIWHTDSWLTELGCNNIVGCNTYEDLVNIGKQRWLEK